MLEYIILGFLMHGDMSGYDVKRHMGHSTACFYDASFGSIYPMLGKLQGEELVTMIESVGDGKYKKLYSITDKGRKRFLEWLGEPIEIDRSGHSFLVRIFFYGWLEPARARALVSDYIARLEAELASLTKLGGEIKGGAGFYEYSTLEYGLGYYAFAIGWCREFLEKSLRLEQAGEIRKRGAEE
jgi:DNA-binding PadR family transcriptional regulator